MHTPSSGKPAAVRRRTIAAATLTRLNPIARGALVALAVLLTTVLIPGRLAPYSPTAMAPAVILQPPGAAHWLGTDQYGRDVLSRLIFGTRVSMSLGIVSVVITVAISLPAGLLAGYFGGGVDSAIMRLMDVMLAFPGILLALMVVTLLGPGLTHAMIAVGIGQAPAYARVVRASTLTARAQAYVEAALAMGANDVRIMARHILPNAIQPLIVLSTVGFASAIVIGSSLGFLGLGAQPPTAEWGTMVSEGRQYLRSQWWVPAFPGAMVGLAVLTFNILGDALRDILDPRLRI